VTIREEFHAGASNHGKPSILVIGAAVDQETMEILKRVDSMPQVQTYNFHWAIINSIETAREEPVDIISTVPTRDYPFTDKLFWGFKRIQREKSHQCRFVIMPFINLIGLKQITRFLSSFFFAFSWLWWHRKERRKVLLLYGLIVSHLYAAIILRRFFCCKVIAIVTDPPTTKRSDESLIYLPARVFDQKLLLRSLPSLDGLVVLAEPTSKLLAPEVPAIVVEGIISREVEQFLSGPPEMESIKGDQFVIMYAGQMDEKAYGIEILLESFRQIDDPRMALWLSGKGSMVERVKEAARQDPRITYWWFHDTETVLSHILKATVMVVPRPPDQWASLFSFPSKLIEYIAMGKIAICAKLGGIPYEYYSHLVLVDPMNAANLAKSIRELSGWSPERRHQMEVRVKSFAWKNKTQLMQGKRICDFMGAIVNDSQLIPPDLPPARPE
jgi:glycosyltransferase involved in cell wall biosynthesis